MDIPTAFMAVHVRTGEHFDPDDAASTGIAQIMEELGIPNDADLERGIDEFAFATFGTVDVPMQIRVAVIGGLVAGALWRKANEKRLTVVTDEMRDRGAAVIASETKIPMPDDPEIQQFMADAQRELAGLVLEAALRPVTDPPTGDGAEASS